MPRRRKRAFVPLYGLDEIPWADLRHACGSAADVPGMLRGPARPGADSERADLLERLDSSIYDRQPGYLYWPNLEGRASW